MQDLTERFIQALHALHADRSVEPLVELFDDDAELTKLGDRHTAHGSDGARDFWQNYREVFDDVEATFLKTIVNEDVAALEWTSQGTLSNGEEFRYEGVSILEGGADSLRGFRTYYDSAAFRPSGVSAVGKAA
jgi:ketosteroid isomerase-like protein